MLVNSRICKFCKHEYVTPCDGEKPTCQNALWIKSGKDIKKYNKMVDELVSSTVTAKKGRTRL